MVGIVELEVRFGFYDFNFGYEEVVWWLHKKSCIGWMKVQTMQQLLDNEMLEWKE